MKKINWLIQVDEDIKRKIKSHCALHDEKISDFFTRILKEYLKRECGLKKYLKHNAK